MFTENGIKCVKEKMQSEFLFPVHFCELYVTGKDNHFSITTWKMS